MEGDLTMRNHLASRRRMLLGGAAGFALALGAAGPLAAQSTSPATDPAADADAAAQSATEPAGQPVDGAGEEIVVTGFRGSIASAVNTKRRSTSIVEVVSAEEIGKLPDVSIAEALGRLPGLATQRINGRSSVLSIRGLGPDLSTALLNGREQVTTSDNRGVEFDQYPAELLSAAVVYKTPYAGLIGQGLAGTVDLQTVRPLARNKRSLSVSGRYEFNEDGALNPDAPSSGYRATAVYVDQFADDTIGIAVGGALQSSPNQAEQFNAWGYSTDDDGNALIGGMKPYLSSNDLDRIGGFATVQARPAEDVEAVVDIFYSDFREDQVLRGIEFPLAFGSGFGTTYGGTTEAEDGFANAGAFNNVQGVVRNDLNQRRAELFSMGLNTRYDTDTWGLEVDLSYSTATRNDRLIETYSGTGYGVEGGAADTLSFTRRNNGLFTFASNLNYADPGLIRLTDPLGWGGGSDVVQAGFINSPRTSDDLAHARIALDRDFAETGFLSNVQLGFDYGDRTKTRRIGQSFLTLPGGPALLSAGAVRELPIPASAILGSSTGLSFLGFGPQVTLDPLALVRDVYVPLDVALSSFAVPQDYRVTEETLTGWLKVGIDTRIGDSARLYGNLGVQVVQTDQQSQGFRVQTGTATSGGLSIAIVPFEDGDKYTEYLPSANLILDINDRTKIRFGASRTLARARLDQLNSSLGVGVNFTRLTNTDPNISAFSASGGNPRLRPYIANQLDLSFERYFGRSGYISVAPFYKELKEFVNPNDAFVFDFSQFVPELLTPAQAAQLGTPLGLISGPTNNGDGEIYGIEGSLSLPFEVISPALSSFGLLTSGSYTKSKVTLFREADPDDTVTLTVPGLSKWVVNSTVYFEQSGFEARVSHRYRSSFLAEVSGISATRTLRTAKAESIIDAQIGYAFGPEAGMFDGLRITAQGLNLTDEPFVTIDGPSSSNRVIDHQSFGRTYLVGASWTF